MSIYGYARVSTTDQVKGGSLDDQERKIRALAEYRDAGGSDLQIFRDEGISGGVAFAERPAGAALLAALRPGDTVIAVASLVYAATQDAKLMAEVANIAGGLVCEEVGTAAINKEKLLTECKKLLT